MKKILVALSIVAATILPGAALAHTDLSIHLGLGGRIDAPPPPIVYERPAPVYVAPPPVVVYERPRYVYAPPPRVVYGPTVVYGGYYGPYYRRPYGYHY